MGSNLYISYLTVNTKPPGSLWLSRTIKLPFLPLSNIIVSASLAVIAPWNHLTITETFYVVSIQPNYKILDADNN